jgi:hypothetical protein
MLQLFTYADDPLRYSSCNPPLPAPKPPLHPAGPDYLLYVNALLNLLATLPKEGGENAILEIRSRLLPLLFGPAIITDRAQQVRVGLTSEVTKYKHYI